MITILPMAKVDYTKYDEVWAIVRSFKHPNPHMRHVPELSPPWDLFKRYLGWKEKGQWTKDTFIAMYVPQFLKEMHGKKPKSLLNRLATTDKHICLACFCPDEAMCHRSIIGGMLQGAGAVVNGLSGDYSHYFGWYKDGMPGMANAVKAPGFNSNVRYLHGAKPSATELFGDDRRTMCFTGRRPKDLCGYDASKYKSFVSGLADLLYDGFYVRRGIRRFITGGAQGFDQMAFWAVEYIKNTYHLADIQNIVFVPFVGQEHKWPVTGVFGQDEYRQMLARADMVVVVSKENSTASLFARNHAMCDYSSYCLGLYPDGSWENAKGGTAECLRYAVSAGLYTYRLNYHIDKSGLHISNYVFIHE